MLKRKEIILAILVVLVWMSGTVWGLAGRDGLAGGYQRDKFDRMWGEELRGPGYVPNEIIIKYNGTAVDIVASEVAQKKAAKDFKISASLDQLNQQYNVTKIKPLFKNFKKRRAELAKLPTKDKSKLTNTDKRILRRLKRAPKGAKVPALDRIYKLTVALQPGQLLEDAVAAYNNNPDVEYAELNGIVSICATTPNDPNYSKQWALNNTGQDYPVLYGGTESGTLDSDINAPEAWDISTGSSDVLVAVIDSGVDYNHSDLRNNMWTDGGFYGYDFINNDNDPNDDHGHGTHCAGIIAAEGNNGIDIAGVIRVT